METPLRPDVLELIRFCESLAGQETVLTVRENEAVDFEKAHAEWKRHREPPHSVSIRPKN